ncbi:hypothetical protein MKEN_00484400 [Mycena kentingensis (nom. inval.)]|nr:hypothetical protein MKEN_00484400 [Mycena kentingensis (nom. inval.)]
MSVYDYSPEAQRRYRKTQERIAKWAVDTAKHRSGDDSEEDETLVRRGTPSPSPTPTPRSHSVHRRTPDDDRGLHRSRATTSTPPPRATSVMRANTVSVSPHDSISQAGVREYPQHSPSHSHSRSHRSPRRSHTTGGRRHRAAYHYAPPAPIPIAPTIHTHAQLPQSPAAAAAAYVVYPDNRVQVVQYPQQQQYHVPQPQPQISPLPLQMPGLTSPIQVLASPPLMSPSPTNSNSSGSGSGSHRSLFSRIFGRTRSRSRSASGSRGAGVEYVEYRY